MAIRDDFTAGEVLAAADLNDTFGSKIPYAYGTATPSTTVDGFVWYDENETPPAPKFWDGAAFQGIGGGKILQIVRATDATGRSTTSTSLVDVTGMAVTITPTKDTSTLLIIASFRSASLQTNDNTQMVFALTDSSNVTLSGAQSAVAGTQGLTGTGSRVFEAHMNLIGYAAPATSSAVTYKLRFSSSVNTTTTELKNNQLTGQMFAIEVSA